MMRRDECLKLLARHHTDEIVVPVYQAAFEWRAIKPDSLIYLGVGAMGVTGRRGGVGDAARSGATSGGVSEGSAPTVAAAAACSALGASGSG